MSGFTDHVRNTFIANGGINPVITNNPARYADRQRQWFDPETRRFIQEKAKYSSDFMVTQVQGLYDDAPTAWSTWRIRFAEVVRPSSAIQRHFDDYKQFLFESAKIEYVRPGTKFVTMGNTWLVTNPANVSGASGSGICRRCNAVWNYLDYYGNVVSEPIIVENERANANDSDAQNSQLISKGYFNVICQYNDATRQIDTNTRMILGTAAYRVTGYSDFETEFTGDYGTVRLLSFSVRYEEPNDAIDDMVNHVASGKTFKWDITITGQSNLRVGTTTYLTATSSRNDVSLNDISVVENTLISPKTWSASQDYVTTDEKCAVNGTALITTVPVVNYMWSSSDESVATVDEYGLVTAISDGTAIITATLQQNPSYKTDYLITVTAIQDSVEFTSTVPSTLSAYETVVISAMYFEDGMETSEALAWKFSGADIAAYAAVVADDGLSATITCYGYSSKPLDVSVSYGNYTAHAEIILQGI